jgi:hypothetical protein
VEDGVLGVPLLVKGEIVVGKWVDGWKGMARVLCGCVSLGGARVYAARLELILHYKGLSSQMCEKKE